MSKTAFVLSGGGSRGGYEIGVWQALSRLNIPIDIVTGTSVGAINGAMVAQNRQRSAIKLWKTLETDMIFDLEKEKGESKPKDKSGESKLPSIGGIPPKEALAYAREIITNGGAGHSGLASLLLQYIDEKAMRNSSVDYGLVTVEFPSMKPHYLYLEDIPHGRLHDYILASASCFPAVQIMRIDGIGYIDGGYADVLPVELAMKKGADRIIAVDLQAAGFQRHDTLKKAEETLEEFRIIKSPWDLGNFLVFDQANTRRLIRLGYLDAMKSFHQLDGKKYTFKKGTLPSRDLPLAEHAADSFHLDPVRIYNRRSFHRQLKKAIHATPLVKVDSLPSLEELKSLTHRASFVLLIGRDLKEKGAESIFLNKAAFSVFREQVSAADYLLKNHLI